MHAEKSGVATADKTAVAGKKTADDVQTILRKDESERCKELFGSIGNAMRWVCDNFDETILDPAMSPADLEGFIAKRGEAGFKHICIPLTAVKHAVSVINKNHFDMQVATVIGFPHGNEATTFAKSLQVSEASVVGAAEADFVINIPLLRSDPEAFRYELKAVAGTAHQDKLKVKAIFETYYLSDSEIITVAEACEAAGVDVVKTSTGYAVKGKNHPDRDSEQIGATEDVIALMGKGITDKTKVGIKPAGGIRTAKQLFGILDACVKAGWQLDNGKIRIGCSAGLKILEELDGMGNE